MTALSDLALLPASELRRRIGEGTLTAEDLVAACLERIQDLDGRVNAVCTVNDAALDDARALDRRAAAGEPMGLLHGLPVGIKDVTPVAGLRTTYGSPLYADHVPAEDALVVQRLRAAGAVILGKTNAPEFATGGNTFNEVFGRTRNPWNLERSAGGSTGGGAAALATGMIALAEGTDLGGSLRIPAAFCGVVGLRPSPGLVPTYPSDYLWDALQVTGPMARTAADAALMLQAVAGPSPLVPVAQPVEGRDFVAASARGLVPGTRLAYVSDLVGIGIDPGIEAVCRQAVDSLDGAGARVDEIPMDLAYARDPFQALRGYWMVAHQLRRLHRIDEMGENLAGNIRRGLAVTAQELGEAEHARNRLWGELRDRFTTYDAILTPCMAVPPFPVEHNYPEHVGGRAMETYIDWVAPTFVLSLTGLPVCAVPCGLDGEGLPVGLQVIGPPGGEERVLGLATVVQQLVPVGAPPLDPPSSPSQPSSR